MCNDHGGQGQASWPRHGAMPGSFLLNMLYKGAVTMETVITLALFLLGILLIVKGGDFFVDAASWIAEVSGIPKLIIGATIVSLATTLPEMIVSMMAATQGKVDMSIGNAVGSVTANIGLIMGISLVCIPSAIRRKDYMAKALLMLLGSVLIVLCGFKGEVSTGLSVCLLVVFAVFLTENVLSAKRAMAEGGENAAEEKPAKDRKTILINIAKFIGGAVGIVWGADLLVDSGSELARAIGISERIIGVTIIAVGTSLPELITTITAIVKKQASLSVGNILGANIIDLTLIMPLCSVVSGKALPIAQTSGMVDLPACLIVGLIAMVPALISCRFRRWQGVTLLCVYAAYLVITVGVVGA